MAIIVNHDKEKTFNAITYFLENTSWYGKKKIYKLLFILDFEHFKQTGRSVTGFNYFAWKMGPVPTTLHEAIENDDEELKANFDIETKETKFAHPTVYLKPKKSFDPKFFSRRQLRILEDIRVRFDLASGDDLVWFTHKEDYPWYKVWAVEQKRQQLIPYEYALDELATADKENILQIAQERSAFLENYR